MYPIGVLILLVRLGLIFGLLLSQWTKSGHTGHIASQQTYGQYGKNPSVYRLVFRFQERNHVLDRFLYGEFNLQMQSNSNWLIIN